MITCSHVAPPPLCAPPGAATRSCAYGRAALSESLNTSAAAPCSAHAKHECTSLHAQLCSRQNSAHPTC
eukprot:862724-Prymnesium_polylepis.1